MTYKHFFPLLCAASLCVGAADQPAPRAALSAKEFKVMETTFRTALKSGETDKAWAALEAICDQPFSDAMVQTLRPALLTMKFRAFDRGLRFLEQKRDNAQEPKRRILTALLYQYCAEKDDARATEAFQQFRNALPQDWPTKRLSGTERGILADYALNELIRARHDFTQAKEILNKLKVEAPGRYDWELGLCAAGSNDRAEAIRCLNESLKNEKDKIRRFRTAAMRDILSGKTLLETEQNFADKAWDSKRKMRLWREVSAEFFRIGLYEPMRGIDREIRARFRPVKQKRFQVRWMDNPPASADSWARSEFLKDVQYVWSDFEPYCTEFDVSFANDEKRLADIPEKKCSDAYRPALAFACDARGLHIYLDMPDPDHERIAAGAQSAGSVEIFFRAGNGAPYRQITMEPPSSKESFGSEWSAPGPHYRLTHDWISRSACVTPRGTGCYVFIPWFMEYDKLPVKGNDWFLGVTRFAKESQTTGGRVHELGRSLVLHFELTDAQWNKIRRCIAERMSRTYRDLRTDGNSFLSQWADDDTGDPEFYEKELNPFLRQLDDASAELAKMPMDADITAIFRKFVPLWGEIETETAKKRQHFLMKKMMEKQGGSR